MTLAPAAQTGAPSEERAPVRRVRAQFLHGIALGVAVLPVALLLLVLAGQVRLSNVTSGSMGATAPIDSLVVGLPVELTHVRSGDVVTFRAPTGGRPSVTHRVVAVRGPVTDRVLETRGDANSSSDPWLLTPGDGDVWRAVTVVPRLGTLLASPGRLLTLGVAGLGPLLAAAGLLRLLWRPPHRRVEA